MEIQIADVEHVPIDSIQPDEKNPNKMSGKELEALKHAISKFGFIVPIITNSEGLIADGEHRWRAAKALKMKTVPIVRRPLTEVERLLLQQTMNKLKGSHDPERDAEIAAYLASMQATDELRALLAGKEEAMLKDLEEKTYEQEDKEAEEIAEEVIGKKIQPRIQKGEVWQLGKHRIACGDSTDAATMHKLMGTNQADLIFTDPPYGLSFTTTVKGRFQVFEGDDLEDDSFSEMIRAAINNAHACSKSTHSAYYCIDWRNYPLLFQELRGAGYNLHNDIVWVKEFGGLGRKYRFRHEHILYGTVGENPIFQGHGTEEDVWTIKRDSSAQPEFTLGNQAVYLKTAGSQYIKLSKADNPTKRSTVYELEEKDPKATFNLVKDDMTDVWEVSSLNSFAGRQQEDFTGFEHPTIKPVGLVARAIKNSTYQGAIVLDIFGGSGSTLVACERTNRAARIIELDPVYCEVAMRRWEKITGGTAEKVE